MEQHGFADLFRYLHGERRDALSDHAAIILDLNTGKIQSR
jgi:hypothetical protein